ncbi:MAG: PD-(D/E)XK nuclease family protein, partial [Prevotellaceae bacterium]|nr:PD-(D/E)XK nuclease family protein [Prevotellaceae bacterium]
RDCRSPDFSYFLIDESMGGDSKKVRDFNVYRNDFKEYLTKNLQRLFDFNEPFTQTEHSKTCASCTFNKICNLDN